MHAITAGTLELITVNAMNVTKREWSSSFSLDVTWYTHTQNLKQHWSQPKWNRFDILANDSQISNVTFMYKETLLIRNLKLTPNEKGKAYLY